MSSQVVIIIDTEKLSVTIIHDKTIHYITNQYYELRVEDKNIYCKLYYHQGFTLKGNIKSPSITQECLYSIKDNIIYKKDIYINTCNKTKFNSHHTLYPNGDEYNVYNKNGLLVESTYTHDTRFKKLISQCMIQESNIRYRGSYSEESKDGKVTKKILKKDDTTLFEKDENDVKVDMITKKRNRDITIGWKVAKSLSGELRIIKLAIPADAEMIMAIDCEFFITRGKERCNKAIVMDIQLCDKENEISVIPEEKEAVSYIYQNALSYKIGTEIKPDSFDSNVDESCSHGIHFYQNRNDVFDIYVNRTL